MARVFLGLGSNINAEDNLIAASGMLRAKYPQILFSPVYKTAPQGDANQNDFLNAVAAFDTDEMPEVIKIFLESIEKELGKDPPHRYGPRTIDLDILLYGDGPYVTKDLHIPHPRMAERRFVLEPLSRLTSKDFMHPTLKVPFSRLLEEVIDQPCTRIPLPL